MNFVKNIKNWIAQTSSTPQPDGPSSIDIKLENNVDKDMSLEQAIEAVQEYVFQAKTISSERKDVVLNLAKAGDLKRVRCLKEFIKQNLEEHHIHINNLTLEQSTDQIYAKLYGLGVVQVYYDDKTVDEIRVNNTDHIFIVRKGVSYRVEESFESEDDIEFVIKRMIMEDTSASIDRSNPIVESVRIDGSRLVATRRPVSDTWKFVLRKNDSFQPTIENYIESMTFDQKTWDMISILARGRCKILFSGNPGSGKTTLLKKGIGELNDKLRIMAIGKDSEMKLAKIYPNKDIVEFKEQKHLGIMMKDLFYLGLRESPDVLVIEEFRGAGEAIEAVRGCTRGLPHAFATAHFNSAEESVEGTAMFMLEEGLNLPIELAKLRVARAFNIVVQLFGDSESGKKRLISIKEIVVNDKNEIEFNELLKWMPITDDYLGDGVWKLANDPSTKLTKEILKSVSRRELVELGWDIPNKGI